MGAVEIVLIVAISAFVLGNVIFYFVRKKRGKGCSDCAHCGCCSHCAPKRKEEEE